MKHPWAMRWTLLTMIGGFACVGTVSDNVATVWVGAVVTAVLVFVFMRIR